MGDYNPPQLKSSEFVVRDATEGFAKHDLFDVLSRPAETGQSPTAARAPIGSPAVAGQHRTRVCTSVG